MQSPPQTEKRKSCLEEYREPVRVFTSTAQTAELHGATSQPREFDHLLIDSVDQALGDLLGGRIRDQIYDYLAAHHNYGREEIPRRIDDFYAFLENTFASGGKTIGRTIIRRLFDKLGYEFVNVPGFEFFDYLEAVKARVAREATGRERTTQPSLGCP